MTVDIKTESERVRDDFLTAVEDAVALDALEQVRIAALGKKGRVSELMRGLGKMSNEERQVAGPLLNSLKTDIGEAIEARKVTLEAAALEARLAEEKLDAPSRRPRAAPAR